MFFSEGQHSDGLRAQNFFFRTQLARLILKTAEGKIAIFALVPCRAEGMHVQNLIDAPGAAKNELVTIKFMCGVMLDVRVIRLD